MTEHIFTTGRELSALSIRFHVTLIFVHPCVLLIQRIQHFSTCATFIHGALGDRISCSSPSLSDSIKVSAMGCSLRVGVRQPCPLRHVSVNPKQTSLYVPEEKNRGKLAVMDWCFAIKL